MASPVFILGAGANADARGEAGAIRGRSYYIGDHEIQCSYPLVSDLLEQCFGLKALPPDTSVEDLFHRADLERDRGPMKRLADALMKADYYIPNAILARERSSSSYACFFNRYADARFVTFNYDSLVELFLLEHGTWFPHDGYGVPVDVSVEYGQDSWLQKRSTATVLHLHGSLCLYTSHFDVKQTAAGGELSYRPPSFHFEPHSLGHVFAPFARGPAQFGRLDLDERVIAPVPSKASGLKEEFVSTMAALARTALEKSPFSAVAIGYSFVDADRESFAPLLDAILRSRRRELVIVSPSADEPASRLSRSWPDLAIRPENATFSEWVKSGCPGADV